MPAILLCKYLLTLDQWPAGGTLVAQRINGEFLRRSEAAVIELSEADLAQPMDEVLARLAPGMSYFLKVARARELLATWAERSPESPLGHGEIIEGLIHYAEHKTDPDFALPAVPLDEYLDALFSTPDDRVLCDGVFDGFASIDNTIDVDSYSEEERVATLVLLSSGIIGNGGFEFLFEGDFDGDPGFIHTAAAFKAIGATESSAAFQRALGVFGDRFPADLAERNAIFRSVPEQERVDMASQFWDDDANMIAALARYIRARSGRFRELSPAWRTRAFQLKAWPLARAFGAASRRDCQLIAGGRAKRIPPVHHQKAPYPGGVAATKSAME
jgi:hypothetical protein